MKWDLAYGRWKLEVNVSKSKIEEESKSGEYGIFNVQLKGVRMEELNCFKY